MCTGTSGKPGGLVLILPLHRNSRNHPRNQKKSEKSKGLLLLATLASYYYAGGELWLADTGPTGRAEPLQLRWLSFHASAPHRTLPFTGCGGYVTFYVDRTAPRADATTNAALTQLGVPLPSAPALLAWQAEARAVGPLSARLATALSKWRAFCANRPPGLTHSLRVASGTWVCRGCRQWGRWSGRPKAWCSKVCRARQTRALSRPNLAKWQTTT